MQGAPLTDAIDPDWIPNDGIPWVCPQCWFILSPSTVPKSVAFGRLRYHIAAGHRGLDGNDQTQFDDWDDSDDELLIDDDPDQAAFESEEAQVEPDPLTEVDESAEPAPYKLKLVQCPHCPSPVREDRLQRHIDKVHEKPGKSNVPTSPPIPAGPHDYSLQQLARSSLRFRLSDYPLSYSNPALGTSMMLLDTIADRRGVDLDCTSNA